MEYIVISATKEKEEEEELVHRVNNKLSDGFKPSGGISFETEYINFESI